MTWKAVFPPCDSAVLLTNLFLVLILYWCLSSLWESSMFLYGKNTYYNYFVHMVKSPFK